MSASVNLPLHHKVQKFSSGTSSPGWSGKRAVKRLWYGAMFALFSSTEFVLNYCYCVAEGENQLKSKVCKLWYLIRIPSFGKSGKVKEFRKSGKSWGICY